MGRRLPLVVMDQTSIPDPNFRQCAKISHNVNYARSSAESGIFEDKHDDCERATESGRTG